MKIRQGFVSNSSSSSFICTVCGEEYIGMDATLDDAEMIECAKGHVLCKSHLKEDMPTVEELINSKEKLIEWMKNNYMEDSVEDITDDNWEEERDEMESDIMDDQNLPQECCPVCNFELITDEDLAAYYLYQHGITKAQLLKDIKKEFENYDKFEKAIRKHKK